MREIPAADILLPLSEPNTPELSPTALNRTILRDIRRDGPRCDQSRIIDTSGEDVEEEASISEIMQCSDAVFDTDILAVLENFSPPKTSKMLQPRRAANTDDCDRGNTRVDWIPPISEAEWAAAPSFLKIQVS